MSTYRLDKLVSPRSIAVVGASPRETSPGHAVLNNLRSAGFQGSISLVNPHYDEIEGVLKRGIGRGGENPVAGHRPQIRSRRRAAQPHRRARGARRGRRYPGASARREAGRAHHRRDHPPDDCACEGARIDSGDRGRSDLRPGHRIRPRRDRGRGHRRQGSRASAARSRARARADWAHPRVARAQGLPRRSRRRYRRHRPPAGQAGATCRRPAQTARARSQPRAGRSERAHRRRCSYSRGCGRWSAAGPSGHPRFAIRPYPKEWERDAALRDGTKILVRPIRPEDEPLYGPFFAAVTAEDLRLRFFAPVKEFGHTFIARFTQIDYARAIASIAVEEASGKMLGVVIMHADANYELADMPS